MSEELKNICDKYGFDSNFQKLLEGIERHYMAIAKAEKYDDEEPFTIVEWILKNSKLKNSKIDVFNCLSEKEKFLYVLGILSSKIYQIGNTKKI